MVNPAALSYKLGSRIARSLPKVATGYAAKGMGLTAARISREKRTIVARNLIRVRGADQMSPLELERAIDATFASYATYWMQSFRLPGMSTEEIDNGFRYDGFEHVQAAIEDPDKPGPILAMPHLGGWEWAGFWLALVPKYQVTAVAERIDNDELFEFFVDYRKSLGMNIVPLGPDAAGEVLAALRANNVVVLLSDRDIENNGVEVEFFGERTTLPAGPATLALRTGAALLPTVCYIEEDGHGVYGVARPPLDTSRKGKFREDVKRVTQELAWAFEEQISEAPEQWHLLQPNWPSDYEALGIDPPA